RRGSRYALHSAVEDVEGGGGEFLITGSGRFIEDTETRALAVELSSYNPQDRYILFELTVDSALGFIYENDNKLRMHWKK
ncbi:MAG: pyridoxamine 5'-phosphate oxidase, partial [Phycisphaerae bacterium]|nr:pyridoxamine 5'-phosphate oxidase [Phycisphaerae bacterium]NIP55826.1 pyridoxamine 5'-phosphate oxidase [Phycisphaerae bacterium]NIX32213.1 pyridoxamine 5'-phosphate oxidase [Phycisphaerae bacterium]